jgi:hypothetical protein
MNVNRYNEVKDTIFSLENELKKIRESRLKKYEGDNNMKFH